MFAQEGFSDFQNNVHRFTKKYSVFLLSTGNIEKYFFQKSTFIKN